MTRRVDDVCARPDFIPPQPTQPLVPPLYSAAVYCCETPEQARALLAGDEPGYVYSRDGHPNADLLAEKCRELHGAERAVVSGSGMSSLSAAVLGLLEPGDHVVASALLYGRSLQLLSAEATRWQVRTSVVDTCDLKAVQAAVTDRTRLCVVETISNPLLRVADIKRLADIVHKVGGKLLVDNTFASPAVCRPLELGADLVLESLTKVMNGHSDVLLGMLCGHADGWERIPHVQKVWGLTANPFDCWMALRGLGTMAIRVERAASTAATVAEFLADQPQVERVFYPGLASHPEHELAKRQFDGSFGTMVAFNLRGGLEAARKFIAAAKRIAFSPSLGDISTTLSHPASTSHRTVDVAARDRLGITEGSIRLSVGIESPEAVREAVAEGLAAL